jgi:glutathione S-transferase
MNETYTLIVGTKRYSSWSLRPWLLMKMADLPFAEISVALRQSDTPESIRPHSPSAKVPALKIAEGGRNFTVWDSLAICETVAERHPEKTLWPEDARLRAEARSIVAEMHSGFPDVRRVLPMDFGRAIPTPELDEETRKQVARIVEIWEEALSRSSASGGYLFGAFSIADAFYAPVVSRFETYGIALPRASQAYCERMTGLAPMHAWRDAAMADV